MSTDVEKNRTWEANHVKIVEAYDRIYKRKGEPPILNELVAESGLCYKTVWKHVHELKLADYSTRFKMAAERVKNALIKQADKGDVQAIKLFYQLGFGWSEKQQIEHEVKNNSIKIVFTDEEKKNNEPQDEESADLNDISDVDTSAFNELMEEDN